MRGAQLMARLFVTGRIATGDIAATACNQKRNEKNIRGLSDHDAPLRIAR
jgi:hypothetical protein